MTPWLVDASVLLAAEDADDGNHDAAVKLLEAAHPLLTIDLAFYEVSTVAIRAWHDPEAADRLRSMLAAIADEGGVIRAEPSLLERAERIAAHHGIAGHASAGGRCQQLAPLLGVGVEGLDTVRRDPHRIAAADSGSLHALHSGAGHQSRSPRLGGGQRCRPLQLQSWQRAATGGGTRRDEGEVTDERLSADELAAATGTTPARIAELTKADVLRPQGGSFGRGDVQRVLVAQALIEAGLPLEHIARGIEAGIISFAETDAIYPDPGPLGSTVLDLATELDLESDTLLRIFTALGMPRPDPETALHESDRKHLRAFVEAWRPIGDDDLLVRAARIYGDAIARAGQGWFDLFTDRVMAPLAARTVPWDQMRELAFEPGRALVDAGRGLLPWLYDRHLFSLLNQSNFDAIEQQLALAGLVPPAPARSSAILFADLAGYTRLTEERGDRVAADVATRLAALADEIGRRHGGRLVKLLGDGVMLHFAHPRDAVHVAVELDSSMAPAGLPAAHIGIAVGAVVRRESDYFGRVVNLAARLAAAAGPHEILVSDDAAAAIGGSDEGTPTLVRLEPLDLKGIPEPVVPYRVVD